MPTHPSSPFSHTHTRTHHQPDSSPLGLAQWACYKGLSVWVQSRLDPCLKDTYIHTYKTKPFLVTTKTDSVRQFSQRQLQTMHLSKQSSVVKSATAAYMVNFGPLAAEIGPVVWGTPANFNGFRVLAVLLHGTPVLGFGQTLRRWTEGATYIWQGSHHVGHWPTF